MEINVNIERIVNGYIISNKNGSEDKHYYRTLEEFIELRIIEDMREKCKVIREHLVPDIPFSFKLTTDL